MAANYKKPRKIKILLLATILVTLGGVIGIYIGFQQDSNIPESVPESVEPDATLSIGKIHQTATRRGKKEWSLEASSGHYIGKTNQMVLKDLKVVFFLKDNSEVTLAADRGILKTGSNDITVSGNVVVNNKEYKLLTEKLNYAHEQRVLYSSAPVMITGASTRLVADSLSFDLGSNKITMEGSVEAIIVKNFKL
ncbi:MAG: LPS export ABC transporter periplasmic protein LptC [Desulfobacterales bacterium]|jgi:LPS export ABC transporter protein LptC